MAAPVAPGGALIRILRALNEATSAQRQAVIDHDLPGLDASGGRLRGLMSELEAASARLVPEDLDAASRQEIGALRDLLRAGKRRNDSLIERAWQVEAAQLNLLTALGSDASRRLVSRPSAPLLSRRA